MLQSRLRAWMKMNTMSETLLGDYLGGEGIIVSPRIDPRDESQEVEVLSSDLCFESKA